MTIRGPQKPDKHREGSSWTRSERRHAGTCRFDLIHFLDLRVTSLHWDHASLPRIAETSVSVFSSPALHGTAVHVPSNFPIQAQHALNVSVQLTRLLILRPCGPRPCLEQSGHCHCQTAHRQSGHCHCHCAPDRGDRDRGDRDRGDRDLGDRDLGDRDLGDRLCLKHSEASMRVGANSHLPNCAEMCGVLRVVTCTTLFFTAALMIVRLH